MTILVDLVPALVTAPGFTEGSARFVLTPDRYYVLVLEDGQPVIKHSGAYLSSAVARHGTTLTLEDGEMTVVRTGERSCCGSPMASLRRAPLSGLVSA